VAVDRRVAPEVYAQLEASYAAVGRPREFETLLRGLIAERPADLPLRLALVRTLAARGDVDAALAEADEALARDGEDLGAHAARAHVLLRAGRDAEAVKALEELLAALERQGLLGAREPLE
jgi:predicted Zn-dependent protease